MKLLAALFAFMAVLFAIVNGMAAVPKTAGMHEGKEQAGCFGGPGGGGPPPPPPTNSTG